MTALIIKHVEEQPIDPRALAPDVPHDLALLILKALAKAPEARFQSAAEMGDALDLVELPPTERVSGAARVVGA